MPLTIVFVERKNRCNEVAQSLQDEGIPAAALHGGLSQVRLEQALVISHTCMQQAHAYVARILTHCDLLVVA
jgi:superfamily II helicase